MPIPMPNGKQQYCTTAGTPLVGGRLYTYAAGTSTPKATWSDAAGTTPNANPIIMDARGEATVFFSGAYKLELRDAANAVIWTVDQFVAADNLTTVPDGRTTLPSGTTADLGTTTVRSVDITGTATIQSFGSAADGAVRYLRFTGACTVVYNATSMILPSAQSIYTSAGDTAIVQCLGGSNWVMLEYQRAPAQVPPANLLINPNFQVNQRGYVSGTATIAANQYTVDRWRVVTSGQSISWSESNGIRTVTAPAGGMEQVIEASGVIGASGRAYVLSWVGAATATVNGSAVTNGAPITTIAGGSNVTVRFANGTVSQPKFEVGFSATPFENRLFAEELMLCQRYYQVVGAGFSGRWYATTGAAVAGTLPVVMRAVPTPTLIPTAVIEEIGVGGRSAAAPTSGGGNFFSNGVYVVVNGFTGAVVGNTAIGVSNFLALSAEL